MEEYDVIVVGAGPGGCASAYYHAKDYKKVLLLDSKSFPRDKICGDGVTGKSLAILESMGVLEEVVKSRSYTCKEVLLTSPDKTAITIPLINDNERHMAFCLERHIFDNLIFEKTVEMVESHGGKVLQGFTVTEALFSNTSKGDTNRMIGVRGKKSGNYENYHAPKIIGAGGYNCPIARAVIVNQYDEQYQDRNHTSAAYRQYWEGVEGNSGQFEIHFLDEIQPGYFWLFPVGPNRINVGIGMLMSEMDSRTVKLKEMQEDIINNHPLFKDRFANATLVENTSKGWILPLGSPRKKQSLQPRRAHMLGCFLVGDAACLIDPFTGEGIGNALTSGMYSADYSAETLEGGVKYQKALWDEIGQELTNSHRLQKMLNHKRIVNWVFKKASKKEALQDAFTEMLTDKEKQSKLTTWFLVRNLLF